MIYLGTADFITSDLHIDSEWVAKIRAGGHVDVMNDRMAQKWDDQVHENSTVLILGDVMDLEESFFVQARVLDWFDARPGRKVLVPGNNDVVHPMHMTPKQMPVHPRWRDTFYLMPFLQLVTLTSVDYTLALRACHFPYAHRDGKNWQWEDSKVKGLIHGHTHKKQRLSTSPAGAKMVHVGWDAWKGLANVLDVIDEYEGVDS